MDIDDKPRRLYSLAGLPSHLYEGTGNRKRKPLPVYEPYEEELPLESGYYTFVIDERGRFRIDRGNTSSHASLVGNQRVGAAGHFWIARSGKVGFVNCRSLDYKIYLKSEKHVTVRYVIEAFRRHQAFEMSEFTYFKFPTSLTDSFSVSLAGEVIADEQDRHRIIEAEGVGAVSTGKFRTSQLEMHADYKPRLPPKLIPMKSDQIAFVNDSDDILFEYAPPSLPYCPEDGPLTPGKKAFIIDKDGNLVIGHGHQLLSGGNPVGAAGQILVDQQSVIVTVNLNFSGHYRPPLTMAYAQYTFRALATHPLLSISKSCTISGRLQFDIRKSLEPVFFEAQELLCDIDTNIGKYDDDSEPKYEIDESVDDDLNWN